ncbi:hypothetical protein GT037_005900 [Alternaria burnsii]|uniref:Uncharacterized protein n=1 Tax=Alternaria burnsii TaxID=1187904 RepID=A0A8H7BBT4_9PLEO|nr:uncharacterized protein GT037_005900 [Alternaria burnsii]KAF7676395.1 hypothetical protein GT037_005900 [Alternaria burnsii]
MQLTSTLLSSLALTIGALTVEKPLSFTTWACNNCASPADTVNGPCARTDHQIRQSDICITTPLPPLTNQGSLVVDFAKPGCTRSTLVDVEGINNNMRWFFPSQMTWYSYRTTTSQLTIVVVFIYGNSKCEGHGDQTCGFVVSNVCRPIVFGARAAYKVICS